MSDQEKAPTLSFQCPKLWQNMPGSETERFCDSCGHQVQNLSLLSKEERADLINNSSEQRICGVYHQDLNGNLITANSQDELTRKIKAIRLAAIAAGSLALASCGSSEKETDTPPPNKPVPLDGMVLGYLCPLPTE